MAIPDDQSHGHVLEHELPPHEAVVRRRRGGEREHGRQGEPVVQPRFEVEGVADDPRHTRVRDHGGRQHGIGGREQRAEQEALGPVEIGHGVGQRRHQDRGERHRQHELAERQVPGRLEHLLLDLEAVAEQDQHERHHREALHEAAGGIELEHLEPAVAQHEAGDHEARREREEAALGETRDERAEDQQHAEDRERRLQELHTGGERRHRAHSARRPRQIRLR